MWQFNGVILLMVKVQIIPNTLTNTLTDTRSDTRSDTRLLTHTFHKRPRLFINTRSQAMQSIKILRAPRQPSTRTINTTQLRLSRSMYRQFQDTQLWSMARLSVTRLLCLLILAKIRLLLTQLTPELKQSSTKKMVMKSVSK